MSMPTDDPMESALEAPETPVRRGGGWSLIALVAGDGCEPPPGSSEAEALGAWCAVTALWHPSFLTRADALPRIESVDGPSPPGPREVRIVAEGTLERLPSGYRTEAEEAGTILIESGTDRPALIRAIQERLGAVGTPETAEADEMVAVAADFLALGTAHWFLKDLTIAMGHADALDHESLAREALTGADVWQTGDRPTAINRLRASFELLTQARERYYPVDAYLIDMCLLDAAMPGGVLADALTARSAITFIATARAVENQAERDAERVAALREAISEGWADIAGGAYTEVEEPLLPVESVLWQFRKGGSVYRAHLDNRNVETLGRRRFGLYPQLPQVARRFGFRFALHLGFDAGRFPIRAEAKRLWESPDGTSLEALTRPPLGADKALTGSQFPWRLAQSMREDHVATLPLIHWPHGLAPWFVDLRRSSNYSPVFARWVTLNDYFHLTDRPFEGFRPEPDQYVTPYLAQAIARKDTAPISRKASHARLRARFDALSVTRAVALSLMSTPSEPADDPCPTALEETLETGSHDAARSALDHQEPLWAGALAHALVGSATAGRPGYLVFNPLGVARRVPVLLPDAQPDLRPEGPLRAAQFTDEGVWGVVDLPAFGFAWVPREPNVEVPQILGGALSARERTLKNETLQVEIDKNTGGLRSICAVKEETARVGQQLVINGLVGADGKPAPSRMQCNRFEVDYAGPALVQAFSTGSLLDPRDGRKLAAFYQRYRLWSGRPLLDVEITLSELDTAWLERLASADPWAHNLACRWAWPDPNSMLRRTGLLAPELTEADRPETPDAFDISTRRQRTGLLFGGLAHHQRHGTRMLDTLLVAGRETERSFRVGVVLDQEHLFHAALDFITPAFVVPTDAGPPKSGPTGWLFYLDSKSVAVTHIEHVDASGDGRGWGVAIHVLETSGSPSRCRLRCFRNPTWARQTDFQNELIVDLPIDGDAVLIDLTPHELARIDVTLG